ncbi:hypothetical protein OQA88_8868 [Cercophora sp. LCS_1]
MENAEKGKSKEEAEKGLEALHDEMVTNFRDAYAKLGVPETLVLSAKAEGGFPLYLSRGGFRGWGYLLLLHISQMSDSQYPISIINGYTVSKKRFGDTKALEEVAQNAHSVFRIPNKRRK